MLVTIIAWIVLGAIAGYIAGMLVKGDERWGVVGHIVLGIVGAFVGGFLADALGFGKGASGGGDVVNIYSIVVAIIGAVIAVVVVNMLTRRRV
ncbi:MAG: GlsB/YeaQ/YmgE family stress response membrane protein [Candidatus Limnocylindrales bacterium]